MANGYIVVSTYVNVEGHPQYTDNCRVFIEENEDGQTAKEQAMELYKNLSSGALDTDTHQVYSASVCEIIESTEAHYMDIDN
jgi:hypothetical protein